MHTLIEDRLCLFALHSSRAFGERLALHLGVSLGAHEERNFEDGEHKSRPLEDVAGRDVFVVHSLYGEPNESGNDKLCRLLFFIGALKDAGAARVTAVVPYLAYARKDRQTKERDPVTTRYVACLFEAVGTDALMTLDVHNLAAYQNAFRCRTVHLEAGSLFTKFLLPQLAGLDPVVVSPDAGGIKRAEAFRQGLAEALGRPVGMAVAEKYRSAGVVSGNLLVGDVDGRTAIIVDDLISTGTTVARAAAACRDGGAASVMALASHGLFTDKAGEVLGGPLLQQLVVSDSVAPGRGGADALQTKLAVVSSAALFGDAIMQLHNGM
ncbi:ribose-phosphate diphosphokinase [Massilia sp. GCM10020059]|uniref:ribose-phosphate diphosphokinase n=1 Tax=Massilia agrisoli TaxID=2892444 RepID=A0ABS8ITY2_9BURK|nr:ribose-phosphate diphosphokinase [Massilia agrisoli]MCC6072014.1 ribose-phosphate diphosphokinase [Massilia agrisoli]